MKRYLEMFKFYLKAETNFKLDYFFSIISYAIHVFTLNALWDYILKDMTLQGYTKSQLIWYIVVGEFLAYSVGKQNYIKVSNMIKNGDVANLLVKPISFMKYVFVQESTCIVNIVVNFVFGIILGIAMAGTFSISFIHIVLFLISLALGLLLAMFIQIFIGMLAFLTEENKSFYMVISKAMLLLILTPLEFFPVYAQKILSFLPTTYVVYAPAKILVNFDIQTALSLIIYQVVSLIIVFTAVYALNVKGVRKINVNGG